MAFVASNNTNYPNTLSLGPIKMQLLTYAAASGDTSGTVTADRMTRIVAVFVDGKIFQTSAATFAANVATLTFADPVATVVGDVIVLGI